LRYIFREGNTQDGVIQQLDARVKLVLLIAFILSIALLARPSAVQLAVCLCVLAAIAAAARLAVIQVLRRALLVVPFVGFFSLVVFLSGDGQRAWSILAKSYLSALTVAIVISTTAFPRLVAAARFFRVPAFLVEVMQLIYRYLFVLAAEARVMQTAFAARGGSTGRRALEASAGIIAVLFSRSYEKAAMVYQAMCGRGFSGTLSRAEWRPLRVSDIAILSAGLLLATVVHFISI